MVAAWRTQDLSSAGYPGLGQGHWLWLCLRWRQGHPDSVVCEASSNEHKLPLLRNPMTAGSRILVGPLAQPPFLSSPQWER